MFSLLREYTIEPVLWLLTPYTNFELELTEHEEKPFVWILAKGRTRSRSYLVRRSDEARNPGIAR